MNLAEPTRVVTPTLDGPVLVVLATSGEELTTGEVFRRCRRGSEAGVRKVLARLAGQGIVSARAVGNAVLYGLNREHVGAPIVEHLADLRLELWNRLREAISGWSVPSAYACVFGSAARGEADEASDVDILVVRPDEVAPDDQVWEAQLAQLSRSVTAWSGNRAQIVELADSELRRASRRREALVSELRQDAINLIDRTLDEVLTPSRSRSAGRS